MHAVEKNLEVYFSPVLLVQLSSQHVPYAKRLDYYLSPVLLLHLCSQSVPYARQ
jgi:hypothetical protein